jgi:hypothetical protein
VKRFIFLLVTVLLAAVLVTPVSALTSPLDNWYAAHENILAKLRTDTTVGPQISEYPYHIATFTVDAAAINPSHAVPARIMYLFTKTPVLSVGDQFCMVDLYSIQNTGGNYTYVVSSMSGYGVYFRHLKYERFLTGYMRITYGHVPGSDSVGLAFKFYAPEWSTARFSETAVTGGQPGYDWFLNAVPVDKTVLQALLDEADSKDQDAYTAGSWGVLQGAVEAGQAVMDNSYMTQQEVDAASASLRSAIDALTPIVVSSSEPSEPPPYEPPEGHERIRNGFLVGDLTIVKDIIFENISFARGNGLIIFSVLAVVFLFPRILRRFIFHRSEGGYIQRNDPFTKGR